VTDREKQFNSDFSELTCVSETYYSELSDKENPTPICVQIEEREEEEGGICRYIVLSENHILLKVSWTGHQKPLAS